MLAKTVTYNFQNYAGTLGSSLAVLTWTKLYTHRKKFAYMGKAIHIWEKLYTHGHSNTYIDKSCIHLSKAVHT